MKSIKEESLFEKAEKGYYRFTDEQIEEQRKDLAVYILTELSGDDIDSIQEGIAEVKKLTGYDVDLEEALEIRKLVAKRKAESLNKTR